MLKTFHILNQFDIPIGVARQKMGDQVATDYTLITTVKDPSRLRYYFKSYEDQTIQWIALKDFDLDAKKIKNMSTAKGKNSSVNVSSSLR